MSRFRHRPVLLEETLSFLGPRPGGFYVDATVGAAGHSRRLLEAASPDGSLLAIDRDPDALEAARRELAPFGERVRFVLAPFGDIDEIVAAERFGRLIDGAWRVDGLLADLGVSSPQLDRPERGFSFAADGPLDMRMSSAGETAGELIERLEADQLAQVLREHGEMRGAWRLANAMKLERAEGRLTSTAELAELCERMMRRKRRGQHPATRPFQALRIAVNRELEQLDAFLEAAPRLLDIGGVAAIISFHSLEDRRVKRAFAELSTPTPIPRGLPVRGEGPRPDFERLGRGVVAAEEERASNPRSRSARLRAVRRTTFGGSA